MSAENNQPKNLNKKKQAASKQSTNNKISKTGNKRSAAVEGKDENDFEQPQKFPSVEKQLLSTSTYTEQENSEREYEEVDGEENQEEYDYNSEFMNDKEQGNTISKLLQSRPVMFSGNNKDFLMYKRHLLILLSGCIRNLLEELKPKEDRHRRYVSTSVTRTRAITMINSTLPQKIADSFLELFEVNDSYNLDIDPVMYWKTICNRYEKNTEINKQQVQLELAEEKLKGAEPIDDYVGRLTVHFQRLKSFGEEMREDSKKFHLLKGLPEDYKSYTHAMSLLSARMPYEEAITHITNFQEELRAQKKKEPTEEAQLVEARAQGNKNNEIAAFIRNYMSSHQSGNRARFSNSRGRGNYRGRFNQQRREYNRPFRPYNQSSYYVPKQILNKRGGYRGRGSFRGRGRGNFTRTSMNRRDNISNNENNGHGSNNSNNEQNQRQELVCWKCNKPGHKSIDCRN